MSVTLNIQTLIESNPISKISAKCNQELIEKLTENFTTDHQKLFLGSFYCYLNYDSKSDFVIDLDFLWKWLDFSNKQRAKELLLKHFTENVDYVISALTETDKNTTLTHSSARVKKDGRGGLRHKQKIMMNIRTFRGMCLKANTKKSADIQNYFIDLEEVIFEITTKHTSLLQKQNDLYHEQTTALQTKLTIAESRVLQRHKKKYHPGKALYILKSNNHPEYFKIGHTINLEKRISDYQTGALDRSEFFFHKFWYSDVAYELEQLLLGYFKLDRKNMNSEWIQIEQLSAIEKKVESLLLIFPSNNEEVIKTKEIIDSSNQLKGERLTNCLKCNSPTTKNVRRNDVCRECEELQCKNVILEFLGGYLMNTPQFVKLFYR